MYSPIPSLIRMIKNIIFAENVIKYYEKIMVTVIVVKQFPLIPSIEINVTNVKTCKMNLKINLMIFVKFVKLNLKITMRRNIAPSVNRNLFVPLAN